MVTPFQEFWHACFPEQEEIGRQQVLAQTGSQQQFGTVEELKSYQSRVAPLYGAYELEAFQLATLDKLLPHVMRASFSGTLVSLGSGPGSYELWLLLHNYVGRVRLIDISEEMLARARVIAGRFGLLERVETICADVSAVDLPAESADICLSINSLHWSSGWRSWVKLAMKITRPKGLVFLSASMQFPQSQIEAENFVGVTARGVNVREQGFLLPSAVVGNQVARSTRYFLVGTRKTRKEMQQKYP